MRRFFSAIGRAAPPLARDAIGLTGGGLIAYGAWLVYQPAGFIVAGAMMLIATLLLSQKNKAEG